MDNYQLNEEIGKGYFSTAYKGRRRRTINFYAILSTDKCRRLRVLNSVHILRDVQHPSVIKFYNWFETNNHLWVITEYCSGGDLRNVLKKTVMNENSLRVFSRDIVMGIMHCHSLGYLYNDLKPDNLLMDSIPSLRFYNFGNSCPIALATERRLVGTPAYMAPELFSPNRGIVSRAADLWSLGCVMYEMATSSLPFVGNDLSSLLKNILTSPTPQIKGASESLNKLLMGLLEKDPRTRITWKEVALSEFWEEPLVLPKKGFPEEPAFQKYISSPAPVFGELALDTAVKAAVEAAVGNLSPNSRQSEEMLKTKAVAFEELDLTPRTTVVEETVVEKVGSSGGSVGPAQKKGTSTSTGNVNGKYTTGQGGTRTSPKGGPSNPAAAAGMAIATGVGAAAPKDVDKDPSDGRQTQLSKAERTNSLGKGRDWGGGGGAKVSEEATGGDGREASPARARNLERVGSAVIEPYTESNSKMLGGLTTSDSALLKLLDADPDTLWMDSTWISEVRECIWHHSDSHIRPLCMNARIERYPDTVVHKESLPFPYTSFAEVKLMNNEKLTAFLSTVYKGLSQDKQIHSQMNILAYLEGICRDASVANILINSATLDFCYLHLDPEIDPIEYRLIAATIIGLLVRHTTFIHQDAVRSGIIQKTVSRFEKENDPLVKRRLIVCLGELLFYVAVQGPAERGGWDINRNAIHQLFISALGDRDEVLRHYAAKGIENVASVSDRYMASMLFSTPSIADCLSNMFQSSLSEEGSQSKTEQMRSSAICAYCKLGSASDSLLSYMLLDSRFSLDEYPTTIRRSRVILSSQLVLTLLVYGLYRSLEIINGRKTSGAGGHKGTAEEGIGKEVSQAAKVINISGKVVEIVREMGEKCTLPMRGKCLLLMGLLASLKVDAFAQLCNNHTSGFLDRLLQEKDSYVSECLAPFSKALRRYIVDMLRQHREKISSPLHLTALRYLLSSSSFRQNVQLDAEAIEYMGECMEKTVQKDSTHSIYEEELHMALEGFLAPEYVFSRLYLICNYLIPALEIMIKSSKRTSRFFAVRLLHTFVSSLITEYPNEKGHRPDAVLTLTRAIGNVTEALPQLMKDAPPVPSHTFHLLAASGEWNISVLSSLANTEALRRFLQYISSSENTELFFSLQTLQLVLSFRPELKKLAFEVGFHRFLLELLSDPQRGMETGMEMACSVTATLFSVKMPNELRGVVNHSIQPAELVTLQAALMDQCINTRYAAMAIEGLAHLSQENREALLSPTSGTESAVLEWLCKESHLSEQQEETAEIFIRTMSYAAKDLSGYQLLSRNHNLLGALRNILTLGKKKELLAEATKLLREIELGRAV